MQVSEHADNTSPCILVPSFSTVSPASPYTQSFSGLEEFSATIFEFQTSTRATTKTDKHSLWPVSLEQLKVVARL